MEETEKYTVPDDPKFDTLVRRQWFILGEAWDKGEWVVVTRCADMIEMLLSPGINKNRRAEIAGFEYSPVQLNDLYDSKDKRHLKTYSSLHRKRIRELQYQLVAENKIRYKHGLKKRCNVLMEVTREMNLWIKRDGGSKEKKHG